MEKKGKKQMNRWTAMSYELYSTLNKLSFDFFLEASTRRKDLQSSTFSAVTVYFRESQNLEVNLSIAFSLIWED